MKKKQVNKLMDLIENINKLDELISLHRELDSSDFMTSQYEEKKTKLLGLLIDELASPPVQSVESYLLIKKILDKYYPAKPGDQLFVDSDINMLAEAI